MFGKKKKIKNYDFYENSVPVVYTQKSNREQITKDAIDEINSMIGLSEVKKQILRQCAKIKSNQLRKEKGIKVNNNQTNHMIFLGNPGTGKTVCARLVAKLLFGYNVLPTDTFCEVSRNELVGDSYKSSTQKVTDVFTKSLGGVLFIDEAYTICYGKGDIGGKEAVDTLIKLMEDKKDDIAVIMAGYTKEINEFLQTNPGFSSRIPEDNIIYFSDYTDNQLMDIFKLMITNDGYKFDESVADSDIKKCINIIRKNGNARDIRNFADKVKSELDIEIYCLSKECQIDDKKLITINKKILYHALPEFSL